MLPAHIAALVGETITVGATLLMPVMLEVAWLIAVTVTVWVAVFTAPNLINGNALGYWPPTILASVPVTSATR